MGSRRQISEVVSSNEAKCGPLHHARLLFTSFDVQAQFYTHPFVYTMSETGHNTVLCLKHGVSGRNASWVLLLSLGDVTRDLSLTIHKDFSGNLLGFVGY